MLTNKVAYSLVMHGLSHKPQRCRLSNERGHDRYCVGVVVFGSVYVGHREKK